MKNLVFLPKAASDIDQIYDYTEEKWGYEQAEDYVFALRDRCHALAKGIARGRKVGSIKPSRFGLRLTLHYLQRRRSDDYDRSHPSSADEYWRTSLTLFCNGLHRASPCASR
ncbi:type II toxin-antitoxin system RelE/ParE family toxin [Rhizobium leucaenae]|uniref:Toxin ParE1/3/4 n=1 Tax=Rhizobium leucaenae TaxID=29450 RepID=A0A7W7ELD5_9HYPH|nr:type II toxin-antitoxin system RelE/ParE family toxin [Rhizobium leucaenae]MBB4568113.1 toxin ParE1/3/4 [Rhizobium leucaenae]MBB6303300.1 toxin ParE1/3/4 [Rhizobium leucaenae]